MNRLIARILISCGIHGIRHQAAILKTCIELNLN